MRLSPGTPSSETPYSEPVAPWRISPVAAAKSTVIVWAFGSGPSASSARLTAAGAATATMTPAARASLQGGRCMIVFLSSSVMRGSGGLADDQFR